MSFKMVITNILSEKLVMPMFTISPRCLGILFSKFIKYPRRKFLIDKLISQFTNILRTPDSKRAILPASKSKKLFIEFIGKMGNGNVVTYVAFLPFSLSPRTLHQGIGNIRAEIA